MAARDYAQPQEALTPRERDVLELVAAGLTNAEIADALGITFLTARNHVATVLGKLGVSSREEAADWWRHRPATSGVAAGWKRWLRGLVPALGMGPLKLAGAGTALVIGTVATAVLVGAAVDSSGPSRPGNGVVDPSASPTTTAAGQTVVPAVQTEPARITLTPGELHPMPPEDIPYTINGQPVSPAQQEVLADGFVTVEEHEATIQQYIACAADMGFGHIGRPGEGLRPTAFSFEYVGEDGHEAARRIYEMLAGCRAVHLDAVNATWAGQLPAPEPERLQELFDWLRQCVAEGRSDPADTYHDSFIGVDYANAPYAMRLLPGQRTAYTLCGLEAQAITGLGTPTAVFSPSIDRRPDIDPEIDRRMAPELVIDFAQNVDPPEIRALVDDGIVTLEEREVAMQLYIGCMTARGFTASVVPGEGLRPTRATFGAGDESTEADLQAASNACTSEYLWLPDYAWQRQAQPAPTPELMGKVHGWMEQCLTEGRPIDQMLLEQGVRMGGNKNWPGDIVIAPGQRDTYAMCAHEAEALFGFYVPEPVAEGSPSIH